MFLHSTEVWSESSKQLTEITKKDFYCKTWRSSSRSRPLTERRLRDLDGGTGSGVKCLCVRGSAGRMSHGLSLWMDQLISAINSRRDRQRRKSATIHKTRKKAGGRAEKPDQPFTLRAKMSSRLHRFLRKKGKKIQLHIIWKTINFQKSEIQSAAHNSSLVPITWTNKSHKWAGIPFYLNGQEVIY